jgi:hypothetical protein
MTSPWLQLALDAIGRGDTSPTTTPCANSAVSANSNPIGTNDANGTPPPLSPTGDGAGLDAAEIEERAAIVAVDGDVPALFAEPFALLQQACPKGVPIQRWQTLVNDAGVFLDSWGHHAAALGWGSEDLFGRHQTKPMLRHDATGLCWATNGQHVVALTGTAAKLSGGFVHRIRMGSIAPETDHE